VGASPVTLRFDTDMPGDASTRINITGENFEEVTLPIYHDFHSGTEQGDRWGGFGLRIRGENVTFTNDWIVDYGGQYHARAAMFIGDANGMGIRSKSSYEGEKPWALDGAEAFTWSADTDIQFTRLELRAGWEASNTYGMKQLAISSPAWRNLTGVRPRTVGSVMTQRPVRL